MFRLEGFPRFSLPLYFGDEDGLKRMPSNSNGVELEMGVNLLDFVRLAAGNRVQTVLDSSSQIWQIAS